MAVGCLDEATGLGVFSGYGFADGIGSMGGQLQVQLTGVVATAGIPSSLLSQYEALPFYIYYISSQYADQAELSRGYGACLVLLGTCAILFMLAYYVKRSLTYQALYRA